MDMDPPFFGSSACISVDDLPIDSPVFLLSPDQNPGISDGFFLDDPVIDLKSSDSAFVSNEVDLVSDLHLNSVDPDNGDLIFPWTSMSPDGSSSGQSMSSSSPQSLGGDPLSPSADSDSLDPVLKYISQILMEENMEEQPCALADEVALQNAEKSLYDALGQQHLEQADQRPLPLNLSHYIESPTSNLRSACRSHDAANVTVSSGDSADANVLYTIGENSDAVLKKSDQHVPSNVDSISQFLANSPSRATNYEGPEESLRGLLVKGIFGDGESMIHFQKGLEEASKFLPSNNQLAISAEGSILSSELNKGTTKMHIHEEMNKKVSSDRSKIHQRDEDAFEEGRANKQMASYTEEADLSDLLNKVLLCTENAVGDQSVEAGLRKDIQPQKNKRRSSRSRGRGKKQGSKNNVDLGTLLILCSQALSNSDLRTANELLKQIRENSSQLGDASQRLAHYFANGLEARLSGNNIRSQVFYSTLVASRPSTADVLKSYQLHILTCPFTQFPMLFADYMISKFAEKATTLHIIDFGIGFGFQWPILIQRLSYRPGGPCKLRITGIELPQSGLRPAERIEETGRRLEKYCERYGVPFEFSFIASGNWESIKLTDLKIQSNEAVAVSCLDRFKNLLDETVMEDNPRDAVLNLIREIKPHIFVHSVRSGSYSAPSFPTRFREALFHFSGAYDLLDATIDRDNEERLVFEREFHGREIMNILACEGSERIERPETYKKWQVRHVRAGFKALPLDQDLMKFFRGKMKAWYHKDFVLDEDGNWMLQGWRGRLFYGCSCWVPT